MDVIVPGARTDPLLQGKESTQQNGPSNKDSRMHKEGLMVVTSQLRKFQFRSPLLSVSGATITWRRRRTSAFRGSLLHFGMIDQ